MTKRGLLLVMALAVVGAWVFARVTEPRVAAGARAATLGVQTADGRDVFVADLRGRVVLVDFWATWCPPCRVSIPSIERLYRRYHRRGLAVMGISLDADEGAIGPYSRQMGITYPVGLPADFSAADRYVHGGIPMLLLLDKQGTVRWRRAGYGPSAEPALASRIERLLQE